jgi:hypothetical protein
MSTSATATSTTPKFHTGRSAAAIALALLLGAGGWWMYSGSIPRPANANDFRPDPGNRRGGTFFGGNTPIIRPRDPVTISPRVVTIRDGAMTISSSLRSDANWNIYVSFNGESLGGPEAQRLMLAVRRTVDAKQPSPSLKLTDAQRAQLAAVPTTPLELSAEQLKQLTDLLNQSQKLVANSPEQGGIKTSLQALAAQVKAVDQGAIKARYAERDAKFRSILTKEQIDSLLGVRQIRNPTPAATPPS